MNRLERVGERLRAALNGLAVAAPEWLKSVADPEWFTRYGSRIDNFNLPKTDAGRTKLAATIGSDGKQLLKFVEAADARLQLASLTPVLLLRRAWERSIHRRGDGSLRFREVKDMPSPAGLITSPYDPDARYSTKRGNSWVGYKVHLTEAVMLTHLA